MIHYKNYRCPTYYSRSYSLGGISDSRNPNSSFLKGTGKNAKISSSKYFDNILLNTSSAVIPAYFYNSKSRIDYRGYVDNGIGGFYDITNEVRSFCDRDTPYMMLKDYKIDDLPNFKTKTLSTDMYNRLKDICMMKQIMRPEYTNTTKEIPMNLKETVQKKSKEYLTNQLKNLISDKVVITTTSGRTDDSGFIKLMRYVFGKTIDQFSSVSTEYIECVKQKLYYHKFTSDEVYFPIKSTKYGYHVIRMKYRIVNPVDVFDIQDSSIGIAFENIDSMFTGIMKVCDITIYGIHAKEISRMIKIKIQNYVKSISSVKEIFKSYKLYSFGTMYDYNEVELPLSVYNIDKIFFPEKDHIIEMLDNFINSRQFYIDNDLRYRCSLLLHGRPGTGKTSFIYSYAISRGLKIAKIEPGIISSITNGDGSNVMKINDMLNSVMTETPLIVLMDELDLMILEDNNTLSNRVVQKVLTMIDQLPENVILTATTNHIERLPEAMIRSGRFDNKIELDDIMKDDVIKICNAYGLKDPTEILEQMDTTNEFSTINPAYVTTLIIDNVYKQNHINYAYKELLSEEYQDA